MSLSEEDIQKIKNPEFRKLVRSLEKMPEWLQERSLKIKERKEFVRRVWEKACKDAGLVE